MTTHYRNIWQRNGSNTMTYSTGKGSEGFTPEQEEAIHQAFKKLARLTGTRFQWTPYHDYHQGSNQEFHWHDASTNRHSDLHIISKELEKQKDKVIYGQTHLPYNLYNGHSFKMGENSSPVKIDAALFVNGANGGMDHFKKTLYHELGHAVTGFYDNTYAHDSFIHAMQQLRPDTDTYLLPIRSPREAEIAALQAPLEKTLTYTIHGNALAEDNSILQNALGDTFKEIENRTGAHPDLRIVYFNKEDCPGVPPVVYKDCGQEKKLWIARGLLHDTDTLQKYLQEHFSLSTGFLEPSQDTGISVESASSQQRRDLSFATRRKPSEGYARTQSFYSAAQNPHIVHSTWQDMDGDDREDLLQFTSDGSYQVSLRRADGRLQRPLSERQWEQQLSGPLHDAMVSFASAENVYGYPQDYFFSAYYNYPVPLSHSQQSQTMPWY